MPESLFPPGPSEAIAAALAQPVIATLCQAANSRTPLIAADGVALDRAVRLHLDQMIATLRRQQADADTSMAEERARWEAIELPKALRTAVHALRGKPAPGAAP